MSADVTEREGGSRKWVKKREVTGSAPAACLCIVTLWDEFCAGAMS